MSRFAFSLDKSTIAKLIMNSFPDSAEYIGQLVTRIREYGANEVNITTTEDACIIESDIELGDNEETLIRNVRKSPKAIPYSIGFRYFGDLEVLGINGEKGYHLYTGEDGIEIDEIDTDIPKGTKIILSERKKGVNEKAYCIEKFEHSDLEVILNDKTINKVTENEYIFQEKNISGKVIITDSSGEQHFYYGGKKIKEGELGIPHLLFVYHEHPFSPVFSHNDISDYDEETIIEERTRIVNEVIQEFISQDKISYEHLVDILHHSFESEDSILSEDTLAVVKEYPLFENQNTSFNDLYSHESVYVDRDGFGDLVGDKLQGDHIILESKDADLYERMGGKVILPDEVPLFRTYSKLRKLPDYSSRLRPFQAEDFLSNIKLSDEFNPGKLNGEIKEISDFFSDYGISVFSDESDVPIQENEGKYVIGEKNQSTIYFLTRESLGSVPIVYQILSMHFEKPKNQMIGKQRKQPEELVNFIMKQYITLE